jgi:regulator of RNase E activity RraA
MGGLIIEKIKRLSSKKIKRFKQIPTTILSDCMNRMQAMKADIKPLIPVHRIAGSAITVEETAGGNLMSHYAMYIAKPGDIIVIDAKGYKDRSCWGGIQTFVCKERGIEGLVIDGTIRDITDVKKLNYPIFCLGVTPAGPLKGWSGNINTPIQCGGVVVYPGDIIVGDEDGVVVIPLKYADEVYTAAIERLSLEEKWMERIKRGEKTTEILGFDKKLQEMNVEIKE